MTNMFAKKILVTILYAFASSPALSFLPNDFRYVSVSARTHLNMAAAPAFETGRRYSLRTIRDGALFTAVLGFAPQFANANQISDKLASSQASKDVKKASRQLAKAEFYVVEKDYRAVATTLRTTPFADVRKNARVLIRAAGENSPLFEDLCAKYDGFIGAVQRLDSLAGSGVRGKDADMSEAYFDAVRGLDGFIEVANKAVDTPLRYENETAPNSLL
uniref:Uncharacterized protein n=1 Tax=Corethron hystrix TaxID=216773 RepID=A0A7S1G3J1_9STRA|mmetsp:Transcript_8993/g.19900  ORF Transcript_8993/g.19900 Transcript_8993/m.19900 type:complete len:218 (+) Transcript_8993:64-717(+)|eukprot:CAMPEP_0113300688 /NCGR_PEP_ID=MMETSP0010_2-20120614/2211_1 /TAXON_ID=216773 ORGANISM="Corethron hystrix, Strain 308" /NCGR_SAMPLE_ID=MMETSP0010_2 /ASSEMBLY_ACC=CAM_ASM_000155 /LENGTH=217 /DNA_ID=CAMNT_0000154149 /DNA_START=63 /DNA_END=716 /DNA_ORIENTATION=- /assembly_acc=CAM_ASM_000155